MKLFLTSAGLINKEVADKFVQQLSKPIKENRVLVVAYAKTEKEEYYVNGSKQEIKDLGFEQVEIANMSNEINVSSLDDFDVIYVCGGNTFSILNKLRETELDKFIVDQVKKGSIYIGVSAGSIIAGPSIEIAGWGEDGDENEVGLEDLTGFNLTDISIYPHFSEDQRNEVEEFKKQAKNKVIELTDNQAVFVDESKIELLGKSQ